MLISRTMMGSIRGVGRCCGPTDRRYAPPTIQQLTRSPGSVREIRSTEYDTRTRYPPLRSTHGKCAGLLPAPDRRLRPPRPAPRQDQPYRKPSTAAWMHYAATPPRIARNCGANARRFAVIATPRFHTPSIRFGSTIASMVAAPTTPTASAIDVARLEASSRNFSLRQRKAEDHHIGQSGGKHQRQSPPLDRGVRSPPAPMRSSTT